MQSMNTKPLSLGGEWTGVFDYASAQDAAVPFTASLTDVAGVIWGTTCEANTFSPAAVTELHANINGVRSLTEVRFRKEYDNVVGGEDIVHYMGHVSPGGDRIAGEWRILLPGYETGGPFVMNRNKGLETKSIANLLAEIEALR